jgi:phosphoserine aminotransferase
MAKRVHNFGAGPGALPLSVLEQAQRELVDFQGTGMSIMEMSHRSKTYEAVHNQAIADLKKLMGAGDDYSVLFMGGGARTQFALVPMNLLEKGKHADYIVTGTWAEGAFSEAKKIGEARELWSSAKEKHNHVPKPGEVKASADAAYLHYTSNNTIYGTQFHHVPEAGKAPLVCDMSSDFLSRPLDVSRYGLIYAGAQKNIGPAGVVVVIIRKDLLARSAATLPDLFSYAKIDKENSLLNTPPVFAIYMVGLCAKWLVESGGLKAMAQRNQDKADTLYKAIDGSGGFYRPHAKPDSRSQMNVTFRLPSEELEGKFVSEATKSGLEGLKGHRSVGGIRASIYNATSLDSVKALEAFMGDFKKKNG